MAKTHDSSTEILINSSYLVDLNDDLSRWTSYFQTPVSLEPNKQYGISVNSASVSNTFPQFHEQETTFKLNSTVITVDNDIQHQNTTALCVYLSNLTIQSGIDLMFMLDAPTQRVRIKNNSGADLTIHLDPVYLPFWKKLGFKYDLKRSLSNVVMTDQDTILLQYITKLISTQRVYVCCDQIVNNTYYFGTNNKSVLCSIDITGGYKAYSYMKQTVPYQHDLTYSQNFEYLSFSLMDDLFRPLKDMRGGGVNLSLVVQRLNYND